MLDDVLQPLATYLGMPIDQVKLAVADGDGDAAKIIPDKLLTSLQAKAAAIDEAARIEHQKELDKKLGYATANTKRETLVSVEDKLKALLNGAALPSDAKLDDLLTLLPKHLADVAIEQARVSGVITDYEKPDWDKIAKLNGFSEQVEKSALYRKTIEELTTNAAKTKNEITEVYEAKLRQVQEQREADKLKNVFVGALSQYENVLQGVYKDSPEAYETMVNASFERFMIGKKFAYDAQSGTYLVLDATKEGQPLLKDANQNPVKFEALLQGYIKKYFPIKDNSTAGGFGGGLPTNNVPSANSFKARFDAAIAAKNITEAAKILTDAKAQGVNL